MIPGKLSGYSLSHSVESEMIRLNGCSENKSRFKIFYIDKESVTFLIHPLKYVKILCYVDYDRSYFHNKPPVYMMPTINAKFTN